MLTSSAAPFSSPSERVVVQIGVARQLALCGRAAPARRLCAALFLDELPVLVRDPAAVRSFVEALLLLQMTSLLPRLLRATCGVEIVVDVVRHGEGGARRWTLSFAGGLTLLMVPPGPWLPARTREAQSATWARRILDTAAAATTSVQLAPELTPA